MLTLSLALLIVGSLGFLFGGRIWRDHYWQPWCDMAVAALLLLGFLLALVSPKDEQGGSRALYFDPPDSEN